MRRKIVFVLAIALLFSAAAAFAADLTIDLQINTTGPDVANNYLSFSGKIVSVAKDQFVPGPDGVSGASKLKSTEEFNAYRFDVLGAKALPGAFRYFLLYPIAGEATRTGDNMNVTKNADGSIMVRFTHRGTAFEFTTDKTGRIGLPAVVKTRKIGHTDNNISTDFSASGKTADIDWKKVWDASIVDGKQVGSTTSKTGKITDDIADSKIYVWAGNLQFTFDGKILKVSGELNAQRPW